MLYLLLLITLVSYFFRLGSPQVWMPNESFYADASKNMIHTGNFITPYYNGELRLEKPPVTYWIISLGYYLFGINEFGLRFFHAVLGLLTGLITFLLAWEVLKDLKVSLLSALILLSSFQFFANSRYASPEIPFTFFITLSLYLWLKAYKKDSVFFMVPAFLSSSLAIMTKGPAGFVIPAGIVFIYLLFENPKELLKKRYYLLTLPFLPLGLWWHFYELFAHKEEFLKVFYQENIKRIHQGTDPFYFYLLDTLISFLPYSFLVFFAFFWSILKLRRELSFFIVWFLFVFTVFSIVKSKIPVYVLPAYPAMSVLTASFLLNTSWKKLTLGSSLFLTILLSLTIVIAVFYFSLNKFFLLLAFLPLLMLPKSYILSPLVGGIAFLVFVNAGLVEYLEKFRHYREVGNYIKALDPKGSLKVYELGYFHHNLPFYTDRKVLKDKKPDGSSIVIFRMGSFDDCKPLRVWKLYTSSESRLLVFLLDTKRGKRFEDFGVCVYN
ncbi:ArnT family glycosyltransferase [Hydrogenobacter hydrogenophilus]|uniref:4-amino-4-deoxy-L-arabinose transferase n=1 Tax=Hydrogenobacter hydrogenophilus TaxID=35835 RepID=A0A285NPN5_9AQUI|nr:glycosyltransferase family 39 protein [Hydrogenobacter hydrogenophilus]SNZ11490.1 4-amino-4-deoxy-L-arabinose transferase [Hydrogenobacter hydrogenophilus]